MGQGLGTHTGAQGVRTSLLVVVASASSSVAAAFLFTCRPRKSSFSSSLYHLVVFVSRFCVSSSRGGGRNQLAGVVGSG